MANLPALSDSTKRQLAVQWDTIRDKQKLTDEEVSGYDLGRQWLLGMLPKAPHGMNLGRLNIGHTFEDRKRAARWLGLDPSVKVAEGRFRGTDWEYWSHWCSSGEPYKTYAAWLETLKRETVAELESIWKGRSAASDKWFEVACKPKIEEALSALVKARIAQARDVEVNRLDRKARAGAWTRVAGTLPGTTPNGATEPKADESTCTNAGLTVNGTNRAESDGKGRNRGPKPDHEAASRVAEIVARVAPDGDWRPRLDDICEALDEAQVPFPKRWRKRDRSCNGWAAYDERANAVKAIGYRLEIAKQRKKATPETLS